MNLRNYSKGQDCTIRIAGVCNFDPSTTVLAHLNMSGISGRGIKSPDVLGAFSCSECHRCVDSYGQTHNIDSKTVKLAFFEGMARTQYILVKRGILHW